jgi:hypothetical protein
VILAELHAAPDAAIRFAALSCEAFSTDDFRHGKAVNGMVRVLGHHCFRLLMGKGRGQGSRSMIFLSSVIDLGRTAQEKEI